MLRALGRRVVVNRNVGLLFAGQVVSQAGDSMYQIGLLWLSLELTGSKAVTGLLASAAYLPYLLFALPGGALSDRFPRRSVMMAADAARFLLVAVIPLLHRLDLLSILVLGLLTFGIESFSAVFYPSRDALLPALARHEDLPHANALIQTSWQLAMLLGPAAAALLLARAGLMPLFAADAGTFLISLLAIAAISAPATTRIAGRAAGAWQEAREGIVYAWKEPRVRGVLLVTAADNLFLMGPAIVGVLVFARETLGLRASHYAWLESCYAGGIFIGAPLMALLGKRARLGKLLLAGVMLDGLTLLPLFWVRSFWAAALTIFIHSIFIPMITVSRTTLIQRSVPDRLQGRVFAIVQMAVVGMTALSTALTGLLAETVAMPWVFLGAAILAASTALPGLCSRTMRQA
jgi:DHA3 family macrolide efflux protein-like MFS transporter